MYSKVDIGIGKEVAAFGVFMYFLARLHTALAGSLF
jgi:hypothetical protein